LALHNQFCYINEPLIINNPSNFFATDNLYLLGILNSKLADFYIKQLGVSRSGGYFEYKPMFVEQLPIPKVSAKTEEKFSSIVKQILETKNKDTSALEAEIDKLTFELYDISPDEIEAVLVSLNRNINDL
jgi:adenine-specific DNA-methyltransferase